MSVLKKAMIAAGAAGLMTATPASAAIYEYTMTNGDVLTIDNETLTGTFVGATIDATFTSASFATFSGGAAPRFSYILDSLDGTRLINGQTVTDNPKNIDTTHPQVLKALATSNGGTKFNLWAWWGDPIIGGDYVRHVASYAQVPAPGMLALFGLALGALGWRRRRKAAAA